MSYRFSVAKPSIGPKERAYVKEAMESGFISSQGPFIPRFEEALARRFKAKHAVACSSGTAALHLALAAFRIGPGDEVIVPSFTMIATAYAVSYLGATPVFVDCGFESPNVDTMLLEARISPRTRAIIPVHIYGRPAAMDAILDIGKAYNIPVVEDAAEAHGATFHGKHVGTFGKIGCFSLFANKILTTGEGGFCLTDDDDLACELRHIRGMAFDPDHLFFHPKIAYNYRMTNMQAAVGLAQVERMDVLLKRRRKIQERYDAVLGIHTMPRPEGSVLWMYDMLVKSEKEREWLKEALMARGIETRRFFKPMEDQGPYRSDAPDLRSRDIGQRGLYLPTYTDLTDADVDEIANTIVELRNDFAKTHS